MKKPVLILMAAALLSSCGFRIEKEKAPVGKDLNGALGFSEIRAAVLGPKCSRCHGGGWLASYEATFALISQISARIQSGDPSSMMPPLNAAPLTDGERSAVLRWIAKGAPREAGNEPSPPPVDPVDPSEPPVLNFALVKEKVFGPKCMLCHGEQLGNFASVAPLLEKIELRVQATDSMQMPPAGLPQLSEEEKNFVLEWIRSGAPEL